MVGLPMELGTVLLALLLMISTVSSWTSLKVRYGFKGFYDLPRSISEIKSCYSTEYYYVDLDNDLNCTLYSYYNDPRVNILFDFYGNVAGLRTCYIKSDVTIRAESKHVTFRYKYDEIPMFTSHNYWGIDAWCTSVLFLSPESLKAGGRRPAGGDVEWSEVWVKPTGSYINISIDENKVQLQGFTKQNCFVGMGMHYFYNMTTTLDCSTWPPLFLLYEDGELIGLGIVPSGSFTSKDRVWFEDPGVFAIKAIVPHRPDCLLSYVENFGTSSLHIFFKNHPWATFCLCKEQEES